MSINPKYSHDLSAVGMAYHAANLDLMLTAQMVTAHTQSKRAMAAAIQADQLEREAWLAARAVRESMAVVSHVEPSNIRGWTLPLGASPETPVERSARLSRRSAGLRR